ncbi:hypothetical protein TNCV_1260521 [Trichonephila clavipes]|nr:hypothetical protein TNCV_1260521 [Trichonephila clavipes]
MKAIEPAAVASSLEDSIGLRYRRVMVSNLRRHLVKIPKCSILRLDFHDVTTETPARAPQSLSPFFSQWSKFLFHIGSAAPAREDCVLCFVERFNWMTTPKPIPQRPT